MSADLAVLAQIFADDYVQYNEAGKAFTKQDVLKIFGPARFVIRRLFPPDARFASSATPRSCTALNPTKWNPMERDSASAMFTWMCCESKMENGSWWRRSWRGRRQDNLRRSDFPCVPLCLLR